MAGLHGRTPWQDSMAGLHGRTPWQDSMAGPIEKPEIGMGNGKRAATRARETCYEVDPSRFALQGKPLVYLVPVNGNSIFNPAGDEAELKPILAMRPPPGHRSVLEVVHSSTADSGRRLYCCDDKVEKRARLRGKVMT